MVVDKEIVSILQILLNSTLITTNGLQEESNSSKRQITYRINKINIENCNNFMNIFVSININDLETIKKIEDIQQTIKKSIEKMTLVNVQKIDINIHKIKKINFLQC